ncbi:hypothetical protein [uncultured Sphingomonas sp.]|uniref:hypothetical protein n=1 Tax=uncultured Sphingomonas sp. TaxID=158754 RepID=UPI0035CAE4F3
MKTVLGLAAVLIAAMLAHTALANDHSKLKSYGKTNTSRGIETVEVGGGVLKTDVTGKGAVLCVWGIYEAVRAVGKECNQGKDADFQAQLDQSLKHIDDFIITNGPAKKADLEARRSEGLKQLHASGNLCVGEAAKLYERMRDHGPSILRESTTELLSIPREPVMNPCL